MLNGNRAVRSQGGTPRSGHSSKSAFLRSEAWHAAISAGDGNRHGHPDEALARLSAEVEVTARTFSGTITFTSDGKTLKVTTEREGGNPSRRRGGLSDTTPRRPIGSASQHQHGDVAALDALPGGPSVRRPSSAPKAKGQFKSCEGLIDIYGIGPRLSRTSSRLHHRGAQSDCYRCHRRRLAPELNGESSPFYQASPKALEGAVLALTLCDNARRTCKEKMKSG